MLLSPYLRFKNDRFLREWQLESNPSDHVIALHPALVVIVLAAAHYYYQGTLKPAVVTGLLRTRDEQRAIYPDQPDLRSPHEFGRGADLSVRDLPEPSRLLWEGWLNETFPYKGKGGCRTAKVHEVKVEGKEKGLGIHLHLQVGPLEPSPALSQSFIV